ncbi:MAG: DUF503 domain-containing protein [Thermoanaerobaculia bacterium]
MYLLVVELKMELEWSNSLKEKRRAKLSLIEKLKKNFNLNVSEIGFKDESKIINLGVSLVNGDMEVLKNIDSKLRAFIENNSEGNLFFYKSAFIDWSWE